MKLSELLSHIPHTLLAGSGETEITALCCDSRRAGSGSLFVALPGARADSARS